MYQLQRLTHSDSKSSDFWGFVGMGNGQETLESAPGTDTFEACDLA